jgi:hypothetical protein
MRLEFRVVFNLRIETVDIVDTPDGIPIAHGEALLQSHLDPGPTQQDSRQRTFAFQARASRIELRIPSPSISLVYEGIIRAARSTARRPPPLWRRYWRADANPTNWRPEKRSRKK